MQLTCPRCQHQFSAQEACEDEAGRVLMTALASVDAELGRSLIAYLGLFRPRTQRLRWGRARALAQDVLRLIDAYDARRVTDALIETVDALHGKRWSGAGQTWKPLKNHNYLMRVLEGMAPQTSSLAESAPAASAKTKTGQAMSELEAWRRG